MSSGGVSGSLTYTKASSRWPAEVPGTSLIKSENGSWWIQVVLLVKRDRLGTYYMEGIWTNTLQTTYRPSKAITVPLKMGINAALWEDLMELFVSVVGFLGHVNRTSSVPCGFSQVTGRQLYFLDPPSSPSDLKAEPLRLKAFKNHRKTAKGRQNHRKPLRNH